MSTATRQTGAIATPVRVHCQPHRADGRHEAIALSGEPAHACRAPARSAREGSRSRPLAERRCRNMNAERIEIEGPTDRDLAALKRAGCTTEIVSWRTRVFAPIAAALQQVIERWPVADTA